MSDFQKQTVQWFPGHMAKTRRELEQQIKCVDAVIELCDARAPYSTRNPELDKLCRGKTRILIMNKSDLADEQATRSWIEYYSSIGLTAIKFQSTGNKTKEIFSIIERAAAPKVERMKARGANKTVRMMVVGIPNVGKSTFINRLRGQSIAKAGDRPGVTRSNQWVKISTFLELLDTPGMLWPKLDDINSARRLAFLGSIKDDIMNTEELAAKLISELMLIAPDAVRARFKLADEAFTCPEAELLDYACKGRGWLLSGGRCDTERAAALILDEFRAGKLGKITLERIGL